LAAYVIVDLEVLEPEPYKEYTAAVPATLVPFGGRFIVRGGRYETLEGDWHPSRIVVLEFPSFDAAKNWYASPEYEAIIPLRLRHAQTNFLTIAEGV
jgi:uncharacterized protein (DUF1330 family)